MPQADQAPTTILPAISQGQQHVHYIPQITNPKHGSYFPELSHGDTTKATIVADIASGQHEEVSRVFAFNLTEGTSWDASKEIAYDVMDQVLGEYGYVPQWCVNFLEDHLGSPIVVAAERQAA